MKGSLTFGVAVGYALNFSANASSTFLDTYVEVAETMMGLSSIESIELGTVFGADNLTLLKFTSEINPVARTFSYSLIPGQSYLGQQISLRTSGFYNATLGGYSWSHSGQLGSDTWSTNGSTIWEGDPTSPVDRSRTIGGHVYRFIGTMSYLPGGAAGSATSTVSGSFTGPASGPYGSGPFGPYSGTDKFVLGRWEYEVETPKNPLVPSGKVQFSAKGLTSFPDGGAGAFEVRISTVPLPKSAYLFLVGTVGIFAFRGGARRTSALSKTISQHQQLA